MINHLDEIQQLVDTIDQSRLVGLQGAANASTRCLVEILIPQGDVDFNGQEQRFRDSLKRRDIVKLERVDLPTRQGLYITVKPLGLTPGITWFTGYDENSKPIVEDVTTL